MNPGVQSYLLMYRTTQAYLRLSSVDAVYLGGVRWSSEEDALAYPDGKVFIYFAALADFIEGFSTAGRVVPFGCLLHWIDLLQDRRGHLAAEVRRLRNAFRATGMVYRNAGALAAALSAGLPEVADPPRLEHVCRRLRDRAFPIRWFTARFHESPGNPPEEPPIAPAEFERLVIERLAAFSDDDLREWLTNGRGPLREAGAALAREQPPPRSLGGVLAALLLRPRLAGAETYVTRLVGALALPPRRRTPQELPVGGYADLATSGELERLLPSQHALEELEFLRRFAERELLFLRREEPPAQNRQEMVVLIDQGVRTWGDVRLVLAAAALALGRQAAGRGLRFALAGTSNAGRSLDPLVADETALGALIEGSDLSPHPGAALEAVLERPAEGLRDVVLLTHPRSLREADVSAAARRAGVRDRLFAVTLDEGGAATVTEIRHGTPVPLRQLRVEFVASRVVAPSRAAEPTDPLPPWQGDVEPVPFPFRFGTCGKPWRFAFETGGRWLLTVSADGMLHLWSLYADFFEVLPRPYLNGTLLKDIRRVTPVAVGFIVTGVRGSHAFFAHYDVVRRAVAVRLLDWSFQLLTTTYYPEMHAAVFTNQATPAGIAADGGLAVDLATGATYVPGQTEAAGRAAQAWRRWLHGSAPPSVSTPARLVLLNRGYRYALDSAHGQLSVIRPDGTTVGPLTPIGDGRPILRSTFLQAACTEGSVSAVRVRYGGDKHKLLLLCHSDGSLLREFDLKSAASHFELSEDGKWLAFERGGRVEMERVDDPAVRKATHAGGYSGGATLYLGERQILISLGHGAKDWHLVRWSADAVEFHYEPRRRDTDAFRSALFGDARARSRPAVLGALPMGPSLSYERHRGLAVAMVGERRFVLDQYGQVAVFDHDGRLQCMFMAFRDRLAAWLPDGGRCGSPALGLGPETPGARAALARALSGDDPTAWAGPTPPAHPG